MPAGDGTGPMGYGPMTGRAAGYCAGYAVPGYMNPAPGYGWYGRGYGRGFGGRGRGWRHWYNATGLPGWARGGMGIPAQEWGGYPAPSAPYPQELAAKDEMGALKNQADFLKARLEDIQERIRNLEKSGPGKEESEN
jgi:hypothetical protein